MAAKKPAAQAPPYDRKLVTAWKNVGQKAAEKGYASVAKVLYEPETWRALEAAIDAGSFPLEAAHALGWTVCDHLPTRLFAPLVSTAPPRPGARLQVYESLAVLGARALRADPAALAAWRDPGDPALRDAVAMCLAEAGVTGPVDAELRAHIVTDFVGGASTPPALALRDGDVVRVMAPDDATAATRDTLRRIVGATLEDDLAAALRARLAAHTAVAGQPSAYALYPQEDALRLGGVKLSPAEVCGFQVRFPTLLSLSAGWSVDEVLAAAEATEARNRPDASLLVNSLAVIAVARDPACAPRAERFLNLFDLTNQASPPAAYVFDALRRAPPAWIRRWALEVVFAPEAPYGVFRGALAALLLAGVDPDAAEPILEARGDELHFWRMTGFDDAHLAARLDRAGPHTRRALEEVLALARRTTGA
ncbi:MAG: hypothetical protein U0325_00580 [Polyangiales bacterium]